MDRAVTFIPGFNSFIENYHYDDDDDKLENQASVKSMCNVYVTEG